MSMSATILRKYGVGTCVSKLLWLFYRMQIHVAPSICVISLGVMWHCAASLTLLSQFRKNKPYMNISSNVNA